MADETPEQNAGLDDATLRAAAIQALKEESPRGDSKENEEQPSPLADKTAETPSDGVNPHPDKENPAGEGSGENDNPPTPNPDQQDLPTLKLQKVMAREKKIIEREQALKAQEEELAAYRAAKKRLAEGDPDAVYDAFNVGAQDHIRKWWTKHNPQGRQPQAPEETKKEPGELPALKAMKEELEALKQARAQDKLAAEKAKIQAYIAKNSERFEFTNAKGAHEAVFNAVANSWHDHPEDTPMEARWEKAAEFVEQAIEAEWLGPLKSTKKFASLYGAKGSTQGPTAQPGKTISNNLATSAPPRVLTEADLSDDALMAEAMKALREGGSA